MEVGAGPSLSAFPRFAGAPWPLALHDRHLALPSGGAAAYRRAAFDAVGGFDERLFAYMEDVDLGMRLVQAGWRCVEDRAPRSVCTWGRRPSAWSRWQVEVAGFARGYLLRKYGVLRRGPVDSGWTLVTEAGVVVADLILSRHLAAATGRWRGWRAARGQHSPVPDAALNPDIRLCDAVRRRRARPMAWPRRRILSRVQTASKPSTPADLLALRVGAAVVPRWGARRPGGRCRQTFAVISGSIAKLLFAQVERTQDVRPERLVPALDVRERRVLNSTPVRSDRAADCPPRCQKRYVR